MDVTSNSPVSVSKQVAILKEKLRILEQLDAAQKVTNNTINEKNDSNSDAINESDYSASEHLQELCPPATVALATSATLKSLPSWVSSKNMKKKKRKKKMNLGLLLP